MDVEPLSLRGSPNPLLSSVEVNLYKIIVNSP